VWVAVNERRLDGRRSLQAGSGLLISCRLAADQAVSQHRLGQALKAGDVRAGEIVKSDSIRGSDPRTLVGNVRTAAASTASCETGPRATMRAEMFSPAQITTSLAAGCTQTLGA
jgi:hypothetical protein